MKFTDPSSVTCPGCGLTSDHRVKAVLALEARCPACDRDLAEIGAQMQRRLDDWAGYVISIHVQGTIEEQTPQILASNDYILPETGYHRITLDDLVASVETALKQPPTPCVDTSAAEIVEQAFRATFPEVQCPPRGQPLVPYLREANVPLFGKKQSQP